jgi:hypothetical protein
VAELEAACAEPGISSLAAKPEEETRQSTHVDLAAIRGARGDRKAAREHLAAALDVFACAKAPRRTAGVHALARSLDLDLGEESRPLGQGREDSSR